MIRVHRVLKGRLHSGKAKSFEVLHFLSDSFFQVNKSIALTGPGSCVRTRGRSFPVSLSLSPSLSVSVAQNVSSCVFSGTHLEGRNKGVLSSPSSVPIPVTLKNLPSVPCAVCRDPQTASTCGKAGRVSADPPTLERQRQPHLWLPESPRGSPGGTRPPCPAACPPPGCGLVAPT